MKEKHRLKREDEGEAGGDGEMKKSSEKGNWYDRKFEFEKLVGGKRKQRDRERRRRRRGTRLDRIYIQTKTYTVYTNPGTKRRQTFNTRGEINLGGFSGV